MSWQQCLPICIQYAIALPFLFYTCPTMLCVAFFPLCISDWWRCCCVVKHVLLLCIINPQCVCICNMLADEHARWWPLPTHPKRKAWAWVVVVVVNKWWWRWWCDGPLIYRWRVCYSLPPTILNNQRVLTFSPHTCAGYVLWAFCWRCVVLSQPLTFTVLFDKTFSTRRHYSRNFPTPTHLVTATTIDDYWAGRRWRWWRRRRALLICWWWWWAEMIDMPLVMVFNFWRGGGGMRRDGNPGVSDVAWPAW